MTRSRGHLQHATAEKELWPVATSPILTDPILKTADSYDISILIAHICNHEGRGTTELDETSVFNPSLPNFLHISAQVSRTTTVPLPSILNRRRKSTS